MSLGNPQDEYTDISESIRHWQNMRFAQLTVFIALTAGMFATVYHTDFNTSDITKLLTKLAGAGVSIMFWLMDERVVQYWRSGRNRAIELERTLGYAQYSSTPPRGRLTAGNAVRAFYLVHLLSWIAAIVFPK
jgi:hypothetical protein